MASNTFQKRQKERARQDRQREKDAKRKQRRDEKASPRAVEPAVPGDSRFDIFVVSDIEPNDSSPPAESRDAQFCHVGLARLFRPDARRIQVAHDLGVRHFGNDFRDDFLEILDLRDVSLTGVEFGSDREVAEFGKSAADILDVFVDTENLLHHEHHRKEREREIHKRKAHAAEKSRMIHPGWLLVLGVIVAIVALLVWTFAL